MPTIFHNVFKVALIIRGDHYHQFQICLRFPLTLQLFSILVNKSTALTISATSVPLSIHFLPIFPAVIFYFSVPPFSCSVNTMPLIWKNGRDFFREAKRKRKENVEKNVTPSSYKTAVARFLSLSIPPFTLPSQIIAVRHISQSKVQRFWC